MEVGPMESMQQYESSRLPPSNSLSHTLRQNQIRRRNEDVDYWRHRSGWYDDDKAMLEYNNGVYDAYYQLDDDGSRGNAGGGRLSTSNFDVTKVLIRVVCAIFVIGLCIFMYRVMSRRFSGSSDETKEKRKRSSSRERSGSRSRSRSRTRKSGADYDLMSEDEDGKSGRSKGSNRSRSKTGRSSSRTRTRSRSNTRKEQSASANTATEPVLV